MRLHAIHASRIVRSLTIALTACLSLLLAAPAVLAVQTAPPAQSEYVPLKDLPPVDQIPAAPLLIAAYAFVWVAVLVYLWTIWRRLAKVEAEMSALAQKSARR
jgi:CcmD family protein